jgi:para-nitrobenzyl esterase
MPPYPPGSELFPPELAVAGSDCLNLNIWSPDLGSARRPVMVWIHGGAFELGTGATACYDGSHFARDGIVCVTINYRVGADGFLAQGEENANCGLLDQVTALQWVQENIAAFGGDPANVTGRKRGGETTGTDLTTNGGETFRVVAHALHALRTAIPARYVAV